jgi:hypothetical protein
MLQSKERNGSVLDYEIFSVSFVTSVGRTMCLERVRGIFQSQVVGALAVHIHGEKSVDKQQRYRISRTPGTGT